MQADSASNADLDKLFAQVKAEQGRLDALVVNAGGGSMLPLGQITEEQVDDTFGRNVKAVIFTVQKALPLLGKGSSVVLTGSTVSSKARLPSPSIPRPRPPFATWPAPGRLT